MSTAHLPNSFLKLQNYTRKGKKKGQRYQRFQVKVIEIIDTVSE